MYEGKNILVLGLARSGYAVSKLLKLKGANVTINDISTEHSKDVIAELEQLGVNLILGSHPDDLVESGFDFLVKNPGIPLTHSYIVHANNIGLHVTTEVEVAYNCMFDAKFIAVTGTNGKTTTSTLIYNFLVEQGLDAYLVGNIGNPISNYYDVYTSSTIFVVELSAQQLYDCKEFKANVAILTNLSEAHLEFFENVDLYYNMKMRIFNNMLEDNLAIINADDLNSLERSYNIVPRKKYFSTNETVDGGYLDNDLLLVGESSFPIDQIKLVGKHNYQNIISAIIAVKEYGVSDESILKVLSSFRGVEHRLEIVRKINEVSYYNDSKSTNIESTKVALNAFEDSIVLILGGLERGQDFIDLIPSMNYVVKVFCYGETKERICEIMSKYKIDCVICDTLQESIILAHNYAKFGYVILFSPACASWDQFKSYEQRGDAFKLIVNSFKN